MPQPKKSSASSGRSRKSSPGRSSGKRSPAKAPKGASRKPAGTANQGRRPSPAEAGARRRSPSTASRGRRRRATPTGGAALRDALTDSVQAVLLTRDRILETFDDAVQRGHITRQAANDMAEALFRRSRRETQDILADLEQIVGRGRSGLEAAGNRARSSAADRAAHHVDRARRATGLGATLPISGYDDLNAGQISERLDGLSPAELRKVRDYERRHGNRKSVLGAVERKLA
jgi:polyhydroxyalkanoate synthesis regulator phasin